MQSTCAVAESAEPNALDRAPVNCPERFAMRRCHDCPSSCSPFLACWAEQDPIHSGQVAEMRNILCRLSRHDDEVMVSHAERRAVLHCLRCQLNEAFTGVMRCAMLLKLLLNCVTPVESAGSRSLQLGPCMSCCIRAEMTDLAPIG